MKLPHPPSSGPSPCLIPAALQALGHVRDFPFFLNTLIYCRTANHTLWAIINRLPAELLVLVVDCLLQEDVYLKAADEAEGDDSTHKKPRYTVSRLSLVCQDWYIKLRPRLFKRLVLLSKTDLQFLLDMLRDHRNGWLSNTVAYVEVVVSDSGEAPPSIDRFSRQLSSHLPHLTELHFVLNDPSSSTRTTTPIRNLPVLTITSASQPSLSQFTRMRCLVLRGVHVRTFSILAHALGGMTSLETVDFDEVSWTIKGSDDRMPTRLGAFGKLHTVKAHNMAAPWTLMWLFAPMFQRHCIHPDDQRPAPTNPDARLAILLTKTLLRHLDYASYRKSLVMEYYTGMWIIIEAQRIVVANSKKSRQRRAFGGPSLKPRVTEVSVPSQLFQLLRPRCDMLCAPESECRVAQRRRSIQSWGEVVVRCRQLVCAGCDKPGVPRHGDELHTSRVC